MDWYVRNLNREASLSKQEKGTKDWEGHQTANYG